MDISQTSRGFALIEFEDTYHNKCSLQKSSLATKDAVWLGIKHPDVRILVSDALKLGLPTEGRTCGWMDYKIPEEVLIKSSMHLDREQVAKLLPHLQEFVNTGGL